MKFEFNKSKIDLNFSLRMCALATDTTILLFSPFLPCPTILSNPKENLISSVSRIYLQLNHFHHLDRYLLKMPRS